MYFDDIETQLHAIIKINQILIEKIQNKRNSYVPYFVLGNVTMAIDFKLVCT